MNRIPTKTFFLIDAIGALTSCLLIGLVLVNLDDYFGMPDQILYVLSITAGLFFFNSIRGYAKIPKNWRFDLRVIAIANIIYAMATLVLLALHKQSITFFDYAYFFSEILVITILSYFELKVSFRKE